MKTYYEIFGISQGATHEEVKAAYRRLALKFHPDRNQNVELGDSEMKEINFIYSILSDPEKRKWYDNTIQNEDRFEDANTYESNNFSNIYAESTVVKDSLGKESKINVGQNIYYRVEIDKSVITWKYKGVEYFDLTIKKIFDPTKRNEFSRSVKFDFRKVPLLIAHWGDSDLIVYKEDFENYWLSESSYAKLDKKQGILSGILMLVILAACFYYFYTRFFLGSKKSEFAKELIDESKISEPYKQYLREEYFATDGEISYINTDKYLLCTKKIAKTNKSTEVSNIPDRYGIVVGEIKKGEDLIVLLFCPTKDAYKIKYEDLIGWIPGQSLDNAECESKSVQK